ncbi:hypothetical protein E5S67_04311 [Microcoleus sp. IPMA8]|uniref:Uncharacterized protein n=1 Tax=Microcoleus asticus IPMA8 TaxID=2563858 RepID=A0ABX2D1V7_9CYAN|nr:hypothetical protein [Microcoleus asticus IPMA8]
MIYLSEFSAGLPTPAQTRLFRESPNKLCTQARDFLPVGNKLVKAVLCCLVELVIEPEGATNRAIEKRRHAIELPILLMLIPTSLQTTVVLPSQQKSVS